MPRARVVSLGYSTLAKERNPGYSTLAEGRNPEVIHRGREESRGNPPREGKNPGYSTPAEGRNPGYSTPAGKGRQGPVLPWCTLLYCTPPRYTTVHYPGYTCRHPATVHGYGGTAWRAREAPLTREVSERRVGDRAVTVPRVEDHSLRQGSLAGSAGNLAVTGDGKSRHGIKCQKVRNDHFVRFPLKEACRLALLRCLSQGHLFREGEKRRN